MKNFDLEAAKRGAAVCTRSDMPVKFLHVTSNRYQPVIVLVYDGPERRYGEIGCYATNGQMYPDCLCVDDLMMRDDDYLEKLERGEYAPSVRENRTVENPTCKESLPVDREYWRRVYAGQAMPVIFNFNVYAPITPQDSLDSYIKAVARNAVEFADALIEELEKTGTDCSKGSQSSKGTTK